MNTTLKLGSDRRWHGVYPPWQFDALVEREKALVDRNGRMFSFIVLNVNGNGARASHVNKLVGAATSRLRNTDLVGWIDKHRIGVLLPDTAVSGARTVATAIAGETGYSAWEVCIYPPAGSASDTSQQLDFFANQAADDGGHAAPAAEPAALALGVGSDLDLALSRPLPRWKRLVDILGAALGIFIVSPLLALCAVAVKLSSRGPSFIRQERVGYLGAKFGCWKR